MDFIAGVDGGGTKTKVVCASPEGKMLDTAVFGPFNMNSIGAERFSALLQELCAYLNGLGDCRALCIGSAGISNKEMTRIVETEMTRGGIENWNLVGDQVIALNGALSGEAGIALIAGTGSICFGKNGAGEYARSGGWGHLIGDEGSGYALGRDALAAVARAWDGWGERTLLSQLLAEQMELDDQKKIISYTYGGDKSRIAALAPLVEQAAGQGDAGWWARWRGSWASRLERSPCWADCWSMTPSFGRPSSRKWAGSIPLLPARSRSRTQRPAR